MLGQYRKRVPFVFQIQQTECGLCCVCMISHYYKNYVSMEELREQLEIGRDGANMLQLVDLLKHYKFQTKAYKVDAGHIDLIPTPAIVLWDNEHYVVLQKVSKDICIIVDPSIGTVRINRQEFAEKFSEYAVYAEPGEGFQRKKKKHTAWKKFFPYLFKNRLLYLKVIITTLVLYLCTLGLPILTQKVIDRLVQSTSNFDIKTVGIIIASIAVLFYITTRLKNSYMIYLRGTMDKSINTSIFHHLLKLPYKFFSMRSTGDLNYSLNSTLQIREIFANQLISACINCGAAIVILIYIFGVSVWLGSLACVMFGINVLVIGATNPILADNSRSLNTSRSKVQSVQFETVYSMLGVKMSAIEEDVYQSWESNYMRYYHKYMYSEKVSNHINSIIDLLQFVSPTCILFLSLNFVAKDIITIGQVISVYSLSSTFFGLSSAVFSLWTSFVNSGVIFERLLDIVNTKPEKENEELEPVKLDGSIRLEHVSFNYTKNSPPVLKDIDLEIQPGMKVALVGKSGSGKSTLAKVLVGLYAPTSGKVYYNSLDFSKINRKAVRKQIGIVPQDITLFNNSIYDNVVMNRVDVGIEDVRKACQIAHIAEDIECLPMSYYTMVTEFGHNFSGGQRQRIALARAIVGQPKILLLDEATSSLDNINEKMVSDEFRRMGTTQVVIAHRLSTIIDADKILVLDNGQIVESGTHEFLMEQGGLYKQLYQLKD